ncbi:MAG: hypothetical protein ACK4N5_02155 [Myxococcales bacterium]
MAYEELTAHWSQAEQVAEIDHGDRKLTVLRAPEQLERSIYGFAQCWVSRHGRTEGVFWARAAGEHRRIDGYLAPKLDSVFAFASREVADDYDWEDLVEFAKQALDCEYQFPDEMNVARRTRENQAQAS